MTRVSDHVKWNNMMTLITHYHYQRQIDVDDNVETAQQTAQNTKQYCLAHVFQVFKRRKRMSSILLLPKKW